MKDQVDALVRRGVKAANLDSSLTADRAAWIKNEVLSGSIKLLYVAPERLNNESFITMMQRVKISLLAVDESHCISQWGASFRPEYLKIARFAEELDVERVLCLTATATKDVVDDICKSFLIQPVEGVFRTSVYRPNLAFKVQVAHNIDEKLNYLIPTLKSRTGPSIVYVTTQKQAEEVADHLRPHGLEPVVYHAGLASEERERVQLEFMNSEKGIVCATIAFGMGIDKADIRQVIHFNMPKTIENYSQEVGRAGRDGLESLCLMFMCSTDIPILEGFARGDTCARKDLELWLQDVALREPDADGTISFSQYEQCKTHDMRQTVLNLCFAELELDYKYIRATTPFYSVYEMTANARDGWSKVLTDKSPAAVAIRDCWTLKGSSYLVDVVKTASYSKMDRSELARHINNWELDGCIRSKPSQVRTRYKIVNALPKTTAEIKTLASKMSQRMLAREEEAIGKLRQVMECVTGDDCVAHALALYFGDEHAVPDGMCGKCTFCSTGAGVEFTSSVESVPNRQHIQAILQACPERDDPRLLARMAFGITSPRLTAGKWSTSHPLFGSMGTVDFNALVAAFDEECAKAGYVAAAVATVPAPKGSKKRSYAQSSYPARSSYGGNSGRGSYGKRARRGKY